MMLIDSQDKFLKTQIMELIMNKQKRIVVAKDFNYSCTKLEYMEDGKLFLSFQCFNFNEIFSIAGNYMIEKYYKEWTESGFNLTFSFDAKSAKEEPKIPKNANEAEKAEIQELRQQIRGENQKLFEKVTRDFSQIRRNFYAVVFEQAFDQINKGEGANKFNIKVEKMKLYMQYLIKMHYTYSMKYHFRIMQIEHQQIQQLQRLLINSKQKCVSRSNYKKDIEKSIFRCIQYHCQLKFIKYINSFFNLYFQQDQAIRNIQTNRQYLYYLILQIRKTVIHGETKITKKCQLIFTSATKGLFKALTKNQDQYQVYIYFFLLQTQLKKFQFIEMNDINFKIIQNNICIKILIIHLCNNINQEIKE